MSQWQLAGGRSLELNLFVSCLLSWMSSWTMLYGVYMLILTVYLTHPISYRYYLCLPGYTGRYKDGFQVHCYTVWLSGSSFARSSWILFHHITGHHRNLEQTWLALLCHLYRWHRHPSGLAVLHSESRHP